jgi:hypothetical protein
MSPVVVGLGAVALVVAVMMAIRGSATGRMLEVAVKTGDVTGLAAAVTEAPSEKRATTFDQVTRQLWSNYHREQACALIAAVGADLGDARILQYWIKTALEVEPEAAQTAFTEHFLERIYKPAVAQKCGSFG